ncbi:ABC transporter substrate-binding protein [Pelagibacterium lentulum]|uniref:ABC transporter substrate-binding protein n=1 Tax=Pelagibacterium lentulum TaxID=2029865 RepID=A0A916RLN9_9HYPH|nr:ABC transporter substrate-binding protein [Pelagibacterium lentulum]GGA60918.1 ABC transporter substrate-binding protein [Pelagibacterium lentulum]
MHKFTALLLASAASLALTAAANAQSVTVYTAGPADLIEELAAGFTAETGIEVGIFQATTGQMMARLEAEAANPQADIVISASMDTAYDFGAQGLLLDYTSPNAENVPDFLKGENWVVQGISALAIAWNPNSGTPEPTDWTDLTGEDYRDLVTMPDPAQSGSAYELVAALVANEAIGWELFEGLAENEMIVPGANAAALNPVLQGAKAVVFGAVDYISFNSQQAGESIEVIFPASGTVIAPRPMMILETSQNQDEAKAFIDYVLSEEGQAMVAATNLMPSRTDIAADRPLISDLDILDVDPETDRAATLARFAEIFGIE